MANVSMAHDGNLCDHAGVPELKPGEPRKGKIKSGKKWQKKE